MLCSLPSRGGCRCWRYRILRSTSYTFQAWKLHRCWRAVTLQERQSRRYDYVARVRPDMLFRADALSRGLQSMQGSAIDAEVC